LANLPNSEELDKKVKRRRKTSFAGDVLKLVAGTSFGQVLGVLAAPILARLYAPEAFGLVALFTSFVTILGVLSNLRYELSVMLPEDDCDATNLLAVSLLASGFVSALVWMVIRLTGPLILRALNAPELGPFLGLIPISLFLLGVFQALNYWNSRTKHFGRLSIARVTNSTITTTANISSGLAGFASGGALILGGLLGSFTSTIVLAGQIWREDRSLFLSSIRYRRMIQLLKRYRKFPLYSAWAALLNSISWQLPTILLSIFFTPAVVGYYALGNRLLRTPMSLIGGALAQVYFQRASQAKTDGNLDALVENTFQRLVKFGMFPLLIVTFIGRDIFVVFLGEGWAEAGIYTQILSIWTFFWFISSPMSTLFSVMERQEIEMPLSITIFLTRLGSLWVGGVYDSPRLAILLFAITGVLTYGYLNLAIMATAGVALRRVLHILVTNLLIFLPAGALLLVGKLLGFEAWILVVVAILILTSYGMYLLRSDPQIWQTLRLLPLVRRVEKPAGSAK
jgi:lipopolysaccharide exporter